MMRSSGSKGKDVTNGPEDPPFENGLSQTEDGGEEEVQRLAARVVDDVVKRASETADRRSRGNSPARPHKLAELKKLPTIQVDTVPSPPWSPPSESGDAAATDPPPVDEAHIDIQLQEEQQPPDALSEEEKESVRTFVESILAEAMVVAEKKLKFAGFEEEEEIPPPESPKDRIEPVPSASSHSDKETEDGSREEEAEIRLAAEKVVEEVLSKAQDRMEEVALDFPGLPTFQIDTVKSPPPSPESEEEPPQPKSSQEKQTTWSFKVREDSLEAKLEEEVANEESPRALITFEDAPEDVKDLASSFIKDIVGKAITTAEEKAVPTVPFSFEDVDLIKTSGPWYVRVREGFMRVLRSACFCTPRRHDS